MNQAGEDERLCNSSELGTCAVANQVVQPCPFLVHGRPLFGLFDERLLLLFVVLIHLEFLEDGTAILAQHFELAVLLFDAGAEHFGGVTLSFVRPFLLVLLPLSLRLIQQRFLGQDILACLFQHTLFRLNLVGCVAVQGL